MAEQAQRLVALHGEDITVDLIYDNVALTALAIVYTNIKTTPALGIATREANGQQWSRTLPAGSVAVREDLPNLPVTIHPRHGVVGYSFSLVWPAP